MGRIVILLGLLLAPHAIAAPADADTNDGVAVAEDAGAIDVGGGDAVGSTGVVLGAVAGAAVVGGGMATWGLVSMYGGACQGAGCEGPLGLLLFAPAGAAAGAAVGAVVGYIVAVETVPNEAQGTSTASGP